MKKIAFMMITAGSMFLAGQTLQAQVGEIEEIEEEIEMEVEAEEQETDYLSVEVTTLPQPVKEALLTDYNGATATEAWVKTKNSKKIYKLKVDVKGESKKVYIDEDGKWIKDDKKIEN